MLWIHNGTSWVKDKANTSGNNPYIREPAVGGIAVTDEPVWAPNTGRNPNGIMLGDIKAWKTTIEVAWPPLTYQEAKYIRDAIWSGAHKGFVDPESNETVHGFFKIKFSDIEGGLDLSEPNIEKTVYVANMPRLLYSTSDVYKRYSEVKIQFIEK